MARSSCLKLVKTIDDCVETGHLDSSTKDQLEHARSQLNSLWFYLYKLEDLNPQNRVFVQLKPLMAFVRYLKNQGLTSK